MIVTVPLGVLKAGAITFTPALPEAVAGPIARLGMGVFNKVFLQFPEAVLAGRRLRDPAARPPRRPVALLVRRLRGERHADAADLRRWCVGAGDRTEDGRRDRRVGRRLPPRDLRRRRPRAHGALDHPLGHATRSLGSYSYIAAGSSHRDHDALGRTRRRRPALRGRSHLGDLAGHGRRRLPVGHRVAGADPRRAGPRSAS
ncbi:FAD-dependent oxidoreductase [Yinghuangia aomiensis]